MEFSNGEIFVIREHSAFVLDEENARVTRTDDPSFSAEIVGEHVGRLGWQPWAPRGGWEVIYTCETQDGREFFLDASYARSFDPEDLDEPAE